MDKKKLIENIEEMNVDTLFKYWKEGIIEYQEAENTGRLNYNVGKKWQEKIDAFFNEEEESWKKDQYGNELALSNFITRFSPKGRYINDAKKKIDLLGQLREENARKKERYMRQIRENELSVIEIYDLLNQGIITEWDLRDDAGLSDTMVDACMKYSPLNLDMGETPESIPEGFTEVYMWGIPGSGKTCAIGAILASAEQRGALTLAINPLARGYATQLKNIFRGEEELRVLPQPTVEEKTQYLPFTLQLDGERDMRSVSMIELSGEVFKGFYYVCNGLEFPSEGIEKAFNTVDKYLKSKNRKIHFFFVDYDKGSKKDDDGYLQSDYLNFAQQYFMKYKIFDRTTDKIYVILTKSDKMGSEPKNLIGDTKEYLEKKFEAFIVSMKSIAKKTPDGKLGFEPFSIGNVYFKGLCQFDDSAANRIVEILLERIRPASNNIFEVLNRK